MIDKKKVVYDRPSKRYYLGWILWSILTLQAFVYLAKVFAYYQETIRLESDELK